MAEYTLLGAYDMKTPVLDNTTDGTSLTAGPGQALYFSAIGAVKVTTAGGTAQTFNVVTGTYLPLMVRRVWDTGTDVTSTDIHVLYGRGV